MTGFNWRTGKDPGAMDRAVAKYCEGHRLADCARRYKVSIGELRATLRERGVYRRHVTP